MQSDCHEFLDEWAFDEHFVDQDLKKVEGLQSKVFALITHLLAQSVIDHNDQLIVDLTVEDSSLPEGLIMREFLEPFDVDLRNSDEGLDCSFSDSNLLISEELN